MSFLILIFYFVDLPAQSGASMCLITPDKSRPVCLVVYVFCIEKIWVINEGSMETVIRYPFAVKRIF